MDLMKIFQGLRDIYVLIAFYILWGIFLQIQFKKVSFFVPAQLVCFVLQMQQFLLFLEFVSYCLHFLPMCLTKNLSKK